MKSARAVRRKPPARRLGQMAPTPERYREIQRALIERGFHPGPETGVWSADWTEAMKRFQASEGLTADGKISALALIRLGLGPRRDSGVELLGKPDVVVD